MTLSMEREREPMSYTQPICGVPYKQTCENCGRKFYYHYAVTYCPLCEDIILGEEEPTRGGNMCEFRGEYNTGGKTENKHLHQKSDRYEIVYDPDEEGGFPTGARMNREDVYTGLKAGIFSDGTKILFHQRNRNPIMYKVNKHRLVKIT